MSAGQAKLQVKQSLKAAQLLIGPRICICCLPLLSLFPMLTALDAANAVHPRLQALQGNDITLHELTTQLQKTSPSPTMLKGHILALCTVGQLQKATSALQGMLQHCSSSGEALRL